MTYTVTCSLNTIYLNVLFAKIIRISPNLQGRLEDVSLMSLPTTSRFDLSGTDLSNHDSSSRVTSLQVTSHVTSTQRHTGLTREAVKLYSEDQGLKYIHITEETTAQELVHIGMDQVKNWSWC